MPAYIAMGSKYSSEEIAATAVSTADDGTQSADAVDFTGRTLAMRVYEVGSVGQNPDYDDGYLIALTEGSGITVVGSRTDGVFTYAFTSTQTRALRDNGEAPRQVKRQLSLRLWDIADDPELLWEELNWAQ